MFVTLLASRIGAEFNAQNMSKSVGVSNQTISNWMTILETSYTAFRLQPYFKNIGKRLVKTPKVYFYKVIRRLFSCNRSILFHRNGSWHRRIQLL